MNPKCERYYLPSLSSFKSGSASNPLDPPWARDLGKQPRQQSHLQAINKCILTPYNDSMPQLQRDTLHNLTANLGCAPSRLWLA